MLADATHIASATRTPSALLPRKRKHPFLKNYQRDVTLLRVSIRSKSGEVAATKLLRPLGPVGDRVRGLSYSSRTKITYVGWIKRFILFHGKWHLSEMGEAEVEVLLTHLASGRNVAAATQPVALR